jgi:4-hydroxy-3-methylbut-2-enyl diphosphate reductase
MIKKYNLTTDTIDAHFADTRDTLCYATNDNQTAVTGMLQTDADLAIIIGGYNSSNTSHLVELCEEKLPSYFIDKPEKIISSSEIINCNWRTKEQNTIQHFLPEKKPVKILITSGASCPDAVVESVIRKLAQIYQVEESVDKLIASF